jgi:hypothetical protein
MVLDEADAHRLGLAFFYRMIPVIVVSILYGANRAPSCHAQFLTPPQVSTPLPLSPPRAPLCQPSFRAAHTRETDESAP